MIFIFPVMLLDGCVIGSASLQASSHLRAQDQGKAVGEARLKTVIVPLDGSPLAETVLPYVVDLAKKMGLGVVLVRAYPLPASTADEY